MIKSLFANSKKSFMLFLFFAMIFLVQTSPTYATTAYYQPTPYPSTVTNGIHIWNGWINNMFYGQAFQQDDKLQIGGWGDFYRTYTKFDVRGLPSNVSQAVLWLMPYGLGGAGGTSVNFNLVTNNWTTGMTWNTQPSAVSLGAVPSPVVNQWWGTNITPWYNPWISNQASNFGLRLDPVSNNNNFDFFRSSRYTSDGIRPILQLDFTPPVSVPNFLLPLPGNLAWLVTTEPGGWDCTGSIYDSFHDGNNYFSVDFSWRDVSQGGIPYNQTDSIPVIAASGGRVITAAFTTDNGNYVVIDHDGDGNVSTGFTTRYLHLRDPALVSMGQTVLQGDKLGYMGNTGMSHGVHLHFGTRYNDIGTSESMGQYVVNNGWLLKSFQTECSNGSPIRYYGSSNRVYQ